MSGIVIENGSSLDFFYSILLPIVCLVVQLPVTQFLDWRCYSNFGFRGDGKSFNLKTIQGESIAP